MFIGWVDGWMNGYAAFVYGVTRISDILSLYSTAWKPKRI
jgi:hypothetical protein